VKFDSAIERIIGASHMQAIRNGEAVEVSLSWLPKDSSCNMLLSQLAMYREIAKNSGIANQPVHSALHLAVRQDIFLWMLATWLWGDHEVIIPPVATAFLSPQPSKLSDIKAKVTRDSISVLGCDIHWQPLRSITNGEKTLIATMNRDRGAVVRNRERYEAAPFNDELASPFQHHNLVSQALTGALSWQDPHLALQIDELADPANTGAVIQDFSTMMKTLICHSARRSLILQKALQGIREAGVVLSGCGCTGPAEPIFATRLSSAMHRVVVAGVEPSFMSHVELESSIPTKRRLLLLTSEADNKRARVN
jgi:hypothetical protein